LASKPVAIVTNAGPHRTIEACLRAASLEANAIGREPNRAESFKSGAWITKFAGWVLTALAVTLGAPFWFDLLNRLVNLRSSGRRPVASTATPPNPADE
jgi:hypothetical protein